MDLIYSSRNLLTGETTLCRLIHLFSPLPPSPQGLISWPTLRGRKGRLEHGDTVELAPVKALKAVLRSVLAARWSR